MSLLLDLFVACCGLIVGSYLNVVVHRLPRGISTVSPRSRCPRCDARIAARDNVPLLSHLLLGGRCRACGERISWRYPAIEALTATLFVLAWHRFGPTPGAVLAALLIGLLIALAAIDAEHLLLPDRLTLPGVAAGLVLAPAAGWTTRLGSLLGALLGAALLLALIGSWYLVRREWAMGLGDVKMLAVLGAFFGWQGVMVSLLVASLTGSLVGAAGLLRGSLGLKSKLPFGVFLAIGGLVTLFAGRSLVAFYAGLL